LQIEDCGLRKHELKLRMKCDFHIHTHYSYDSNSSPKEIVEKAIKEGIDCLAITDHGEVKGALEAMEYAKGKPILIIPGIEVKSKEGDILGLNVKEKIPNGLSARETIRRIKEQGGFVIIPHPFGLFCKFRGNLKELIKEIDAIEVLNTSILGNGNEIVKKFAKENNLPFTVGTDSHFPNFIGKCYLEIPGENLSIEEIFEKIKKKEGKIVGREASFLEKVIDHLRRNIVKVQKYVGGKKRKI
jgi:predicted metal-dependent phosphoesterase TrpH